MPPRRDEQERAAGGAQLKPTRVALLREGGARRGGAGSPRLAADPSLPCPGKRRQHHRHSQPVLGGPGKFVGVVGRSPAAAPRPRAHGRVPGASEAQPAGGISSALLSLLSSPLPGELQGRAETATARV